MLETETIERAKSAKRRGEAPTTQAGEFVREKIEHVREGKHGARDAKQVIAIGLSKARRAGVDLPPPKRGATSKRTRAQAKRDLAKGKTKEPVSPRHSRVSAAALKKENRSAASPRALSRCRRRAPPSDVAQPARAPLAESPDRARPEPAERSGARGLRWIFRSSSLGRGQVTPSGRTHSQARSRSCVFPRGLRAIGA